VEVQPTDYVYVNFPAPGIYPFLAWFVNNGDAQTFFQWTYAAGASAIPPASGNGESGGVIRPVALQPAPPATTPAGNLQLSLAQSNTQIQGNQITVNVGVNGITYPNKQYIPLFEGTVGKLFIYNDPSHIFNFQTYNGQPVDRPSAATAVFALTGNSQSLLNVVYNDGGDGQFSLKYNGTPFPAGIAASTQLTVTADDIAWFDSSNKSYDTFSPASLGGPGGISFSIEVDYMVDPSGYAVSPTSVSADGNVHVFTVTLSKPMSPQQIGASGVTTNSVGATFTSDSGTTIATGSIVAQFNTSGFLTGYTVPVTVPVSQTNGSFHLSMSLTGFLDYLNGTAFTIHGPVTYFSNVSTTISTVGLGFSAPVPYSFSTNPNTTTFTAGTSVTLTGVAYTFDNNPMTMNFYYKNTIVGSPSVLIGAGALQSSSSGTVGGQTVYFRTFTATFVVPSQLAGSNTDLLGFVATDTVSSLSTTYFSSTTYTFHQTVYNATVVQTASAGNVYGPHNATVTTATFSRAATIGNTIVVAASNFNWGIWDNTTDNLGNNYTLATSGQNGEWVTRFYYHQVTQAGTTSVNIGSSNHGGDNSVQTLFVAEIAGLFIPTTLDGAASAIGSGASIATGSITTSNANDVVFAHVGGGIASGTPPTGFTYVGSATTTEGGDFLSYKVLSSPVSAFNPVWSGTSGVVGNTVAFRLQPQ
jgi:hypothetical protein